jgi:hypothetical protein
MNAWKSNYLGITIPDRNPEETCMDKGKGRMPGMVKALIGIEAFNGAVGVASGLAFITDPSGASVGVDTDMLRGTPIGDYTLVGWLLFLVYGVFPLFLSWGLITKRPWRLAESLTRWSKRHWAWAGVFIICLIELIWMLGELPIIGVFPVTAVWAILQVVIIGVLTRKSVKDYYALSA